MYLQVNIDALLGSNSAINQVAANIGHTLISELELEIGGQRIDKHYGHWLQTWEELTSPNPTGAKGQISTAGLEPVTYADGTGHGLPTLSQRMSYNHVGEDGVTVVGNNAAGVPLTLTIFSVLVLPQSRSRTSTYCSSISLLR